MKHFRDSSSMKNLRLAGGEGDCVPSVVKKKKQKQPKVGGTSSLESQSASGAGSIKKYLQKQSEEEEEPQQNKERGRRVSKRVLSAGEDADYRDAGCLIDDSGNSNGNDSSGGDTVGVSSGYGEGEEADALPVLAAPSAHRCSDHDNVGQEDPSIASDSLSSASSSSSFIRPPVAILLPGSCTGSNEHSGQTRPTKSQAQDRPASRSSPSSLSSSRARPSSISSSASSVSKSTSSSARHTPKPSSLSKSSKASSSSSSKAASSATFGVSKKRKFVSPHINSSKRTA
jgi:hypothetical protein